MKIGNVDIRTPIFLAPMAGVTDYAFRVLCKEQGAGVVYSEFISAQGLIRNNRKTIDMIRFSDYERPIGIQIFGEDPKVMEKAARIVVDHFAPDILDINFGCPVPKVTRKGAGSAVLSDMDLMEEIAAAVVCSVPEVPVTVKMRSGWDSNSIVVPEAGVRLEQAGVKAIALHPRTARQRNTGKADWTLIKTQKEAVSIPIIGNGDIRLPRDVVRMFDETDCDAVMVGRAVLGYPWFFREAISVLAQKPKPPSPRLQERISTCKKHFDLLIETQGERKGLNLMRKHFGWYLKGFPGAATFRKKLVSAFDIIEIRSELSKLVELSQRHNLVPSNP